MRLLDERLDDQAFEALFEEARALIPRFAPAWTDHNTHDPGITLLELWAWLTEQQLFRLERVTPRHRDAFLELLGIRRREAVPASVTIFPRNGEVGIIRELPAHTRFVPATDRDLVFETDAPVVLTNARLVRVVSIASGMAVDQTRANEQDAVDYFPFGIEGENGAALHLHLDPPAADGRVELTVRLADEAGGNAGGGVGTGERCPRDDGTGRAPSPVTLTWEARIGSDRWQEVAVVSDDTCTFARSGRIVFDASPADIAEIRARIGRGAYDWAPRFSYLRLNGIRGYQVESVRDLSISVVSSRALVEPRPLLADGDCGAAFVVSSENGGAATVEWRRVVSLDASGPADPHYVLSDDRSELLFGDGVNGRPPPASVRVSFRSTSGARGNVPAGRSWVFPEGELTRVVWTNTDAASGGADQETYAEAEGRARSLVYTPNRAITVEDYARLARITPGVRVARAKAVFDLHPDFPDQAMPGHVTVAVVPARRGGAPLRGASDALLAAVRRHLETHRLLGERVHVIRPRYLEVGVRCTLHTTATADPDRVQRSARDALDRFFDPPAEGLQAAGGWPFGRDVHVSQLAAALEGVPDVEHVEGLRLLVDTAESQAAPLGPLGLAAPGAYDLNVVSREISRRPRGRGERLR